MEGHIQQTDPFGIKGKKNKTTPDARQSISWRVTHLVFSALNVFRDICLRPNVCLAINGRCDRKLLTVVQINCCAPAGLSASLTGKMRLSICVRVRVPLKCFHEKKS